MICLETSDPSLVRRVGTKLWPTAINHHRAILWWLCSSTALGTLAISKFLSALPQIVPLFKARLVQGSSAAQGKSDFVVPMCTDGPTSSGEKLCRPGCAAASGWLGWGCGRCCSSPASMLPLNLLPSSFSGGPAL